MANRASGRANYGTPPRFIVYIDSDEASALIEIEVRTSVLWMFGSNDLWSN